MIWKVKLLCNKAPNRSQFWLQSSYFLPRFCTNDLRFAAFFFEGFLALWWTSSDSHLQLDFFFGAGFRFDFTLLLFIGVCGAFFHRLKCGDFHTRLKTSFRKNLKYGENETNDIFTIDNTNVFKKKRSQFSKNPWNILIKIFDWNLKILVEHISWILTLLTAGILH